MSKAKYSLFALGLAVGICGCAALKESDWETVQKILMSTKDIIVLDGTEKGVLRSSDEKDPEFGDWMVRHMLADPEKLNPVTASDRGASQEYQSRKSNGTSRCARAHCAGEEENHSR